MAAFATREASSLCRWASRNAAEMSRVCSVIDWRSRQRDRSDPLPGVGPWVWNQLKVRKASMAHKISIGLGLDFDISLGSDGYQMLRGKCFLASSLTSYQSCEGSP